MHAQRKYWWDIGRLREIESSRHTRISQQPHRLACRAKASTGLGALRWLSWQVLKVEDMHATFFVIALLGAVLSYGLAALRAMAPVGEGRWGADGSTCDPA
jgi:hypothetical protein